MTEVERFIANQERFNCERLNAPLTVAQCKFNKKSGQVFVCTNCSGLAEKVEMAKNHRGTCVKCKREDVLLTSIGGDCHRCRKREEAGTDPLATVRRMPASPKKKVSVIVPEISLVIPQRGPNVKTYPLSAVMDEPEQPPVETVIPASGQKQAKKILEEAETLTVCPECGEPARKKTVEAWGECSACVAKHHTTEDINNSTVRKDRTVELKHSVQFDNNTDSPVSDFPAPLDIQRLIDEAWSAKRAAMFVILKKVSPLDQLALTYGYIESINAIGTWE